MNADINKRSSINGANSNKSNIVNNFIIFNNCNNPTNINVKISEINELQKNSSESNSNIKNNIIFSKFPANKSGNNNEKFSLDGNLDRNDKIHQTIIDNISNEITNHKNNKIVVEKTNKSGDVIYYKPIKENFWTKDEDKKLLDLCKNNNFLNWQSVAENFEDKTNIQCSARYRRIKPGMIKGNFSKSEDEKILQLVEKFGKNWSIISDYFITRTNKQIRDRFINVVSIHATWTISNTTC